MELSIDYKQIPEDWSECEIRCLANVQRGASPRPIDSPIWFDSQSSVGWLRISDVTKSNKYLIETTQGLSEEGIANSRFVRAGNIVMSICATVGRPILLHKDVCIHDGFVVFDKLSLDQEYFYYVLEGIENNWAKHGQTGSQMNLNTALINSTSVPVPPTKAEQVAIAKALSDVDAWIQSITRLIEKKRQIKQGAMQTLLYPYKNRNLKDGWVIKTLGESMECLDNLRIPLNELQRSKMKGDIPYCGANGVLDFVNDYVIDDDIILMAEDGGYFDEYQYRPIAYRVVGKCWVNNHAHILKSLPENDQAYLFYSLVHKNILNFLASGTRAKLNKSEMLKIEIPMPESKEAQAEISIILDNIDQEISVLEAKVEKAKKIKQGMMQNLLTGRIRLI